MDREEIYRAMELEKIIMYDEFRVKLDKLSEEELAARWIGILALDKEHQVKKHRADWLAMFLWNSTALTVGLAEIRRTAAGGNPASRDRTETQGRKNL